MSAAKYLEDFVVGQTFSSGTLTVTVEAIKAFAAEFDPQPFHLDETAGEASLFGGMVASGWHTGALTMKLLVASDLKIAGGTIGAGADNLKWARPVRPGDILHIAIEVLDVRPSHSRPERGIVKTSITTLNQNGQPVLTMVTSLVVPRRPA